MIRDAIAKNILLGYVWEHPNMLLHNDILYSFNCDINNTGKDVQYDISADSTNECVLKLLKGIAIILSKINKIQIDTYDEGRCQVINVVCGDNIFKRFILGYYRF